MSMRADFYAAALRVQMCPKDHRPDFKSAFFNEHFVDVREGDTQHYAKVAVAALIGEVRLTWARGRAEAE